LMAVLGLKLQPTIQTWLLYHVLALASGQRDWASAKPQLQARANNPSNVLFIIIF